MKKHAQIIGQAFVYILTVVVIFVILIYGYNAITDFRSKIDKISLVKFQTDMESAIDSLTSDYGSIKKLEIEVGEFEEVCFVESHASPFITSDLENSLNPIVLDSVKSGTGKNVFLIRETLESSFFIGDISVNPDVLCIPPKQGRLFLRLEGRGNHVSIGEWIAES